MSSDRFKNDSNKKNEQIANLRAQEQWNEAYKVYGRNRNEIKVDEWMDIFRDYIKACETPIIDLGCGSGNNTLYLVKKEKDVIPCDYSIVAMQNINNNFPELKVTKQFDMTKGLPFEDNFTDLIIGDLSLHYFTETTTVDIINEIKRVLKPNGRLLYRVNSINDINYGAGQGKEIEHHLYETNDGKYKRFFDKDDILHFFNSSNWDVLYLQEQTMERYGHKKVLFTGAVQIKKDG